MSLYLDSAYLAKCYLEEPDADRVRALVQRDPERHSSAWSLAELACLFHRNVREKRLTKAQAVRLQDLVAQDLENGVWMLFPISESLLSKVQTSLRGLPPTVFVRAGDAVHLVTARDAGFSEIWTNDRHLLAAAPHFGLRGRSV